MTDSMLLSDVHLPQWKIACEDIATVHLTVPDCCCVNFCTPDLALWDKMAAGQRRILMWATPRTLSTAFTRAMLARDSCKVRWDLQGEEVCRDSSRVKLSAPITGRIPKGLQLPNQKKSKWCAPNVALQGKTIETYSVTCCLSLPLSPISLTLTLPLLFLSISLSLSSASLSWSQLINEPSIKTFYMSTDRDICLVDSDFWGSQRPAGWPGEEELPLPGCSWKDLGEELSGPYDGQLRQVVSPGPPGSTFHVLPWAPFSSPALVWTGKGPNIFLGHCRSQCQMEPGV